MKPVNIAGAALWGALILALSGACVGASGLSAAPTATNEEIIPAPTVEAPTVTVDAALQTPSPATAQLAATATAEATVETIIPGRPAAPAPVDGDFRPDPASVVAATGRPQLLDFFTFW